MSDNENNNKIKNFRLLPVQGIVIYPLQMAPLLVTDISSIEAVDDAVVDNSFMTIFGVIEKEENKNMILEKDSGQSNNNQQTVLTMDSLYDVGTIIRILKLIKLPNGAVRLLVQGMNRCRLKNLIKMEGKSYYVTEVEILNDIITGEDEEIALIRTISELFREIVANVPNFGEELQALISNITEPDKLTDLIATNLNIPFEDKQKLLATLSVKERAALIASHLNRELEIMKISNQLQSKVKSTLDKKQKEFFLRQELDAIKQELGETEDVGEEIVELREKIEQAGMPEEVRKVAEKELKRLAKMQPGFAEYIVSRTYLDWLIELPWSKETEDNLDIKKARKILDRDHYDLKDVKELILDFLAVKKLKKDARSNILCLVGPPGVGKTSLGRSIAETLNRKFVRMSLGGIHDEAEIRGHRRTYVGALPGRIIQGLRSAGSKNPVFMLDEIDKLGQDFRGDPASALLEVLDPEQNNSFRDNFLEVNFDLSKVLFITTANMIDTIPRPLLDRMEVVTLSGYTTEEKIIIAKNFIVPRQITENGLKNDMIVFKDEILKKLIMDYTREAGVRSLEREIRTVCRKIARKISENISYNKTITESDLVSYLGKPKFFYDLKEHVDQPGIATGMAWTPVGGSILFIETTKMKGREKLILTGQLGEVMKESATIALNYVRSHSTEYGIQQKSFQNSDIHIHIPEGAVPKDGPSAGVTLAVSILSLFTNKKVRSDVAMTGELTLRGKVLPVGGIKEKILAARQAGIFHVILPAKNKKEVDEIDPYVIKGMKFDFVETVDQVFKIAIRDLNKPKRKKKK